MIALKLYLLIGLLLAHFLLLTGAAIDAVRHAENEARRNGRVWYGSEPYFMLAGIIIGWPLFLVRIALR